MLSKTLSLQIKLLLKWSMAWWCVFVMVTIPFNFYLLPNLSSWVCPLIGIEEANLISDSTALFQLVTILILPAVIFSVLISWWVRTNGVQEKAWSIFIIIITYYLSLIMMKYGFDKLFKHQFYFPEPNILYTPFGQLDRDILYWSTMGRSYEYSIFSGIMELVPAGLLLFKRTRVVGAIICGFVVLNVLMVNIGFDITVKFYSLFLLLLTTLILSPHFRTLYLFFIQGQKVQLPILPEVITSSQKKRLVKSFVVCVLLFEGLFKFVQMNNFNDDIAPRPYLHGAYEVVENTSINIKRVFVHRQGYLIFQDHQDKMFDYKLTIDSVRHRFNVTDHDNNNYHLKYILQENDIVLNGDLENKKINLSLRRMTKRSK